MRLDRRALLRQTSHTFLGLGFVSLLAACAQPAPQAGTAAGAPTSAPAAAAPTAVTAATTAPAAPAGTGQRTTLKWGVSQEIAHLNPHLSNWRTDITVYENMFDPLTRHDPDMNLIPGLATEWNALDDRTWQFKLRPNVKFHNGDPFTAADVKFSIERTWDPAARTLVATVFSSVDHVEAVDDLTVNFVMKGPDPLLPARHAWNGGHIMPARYFQQVGPDAFDKAPVGTGPYQFQEWVKGDHLTLKPNDSYWGGAPNTAGILVLPKPDPAARAAALLAGDVNFIDEIPPDQVATVAGDSRFQVVDATIDGLNELGLNVQVPPLDSQPLRQALSTAINRQALVDDLLLGKGIVATGWIPRGDFAYDASLPPLAFDQTTARSLLGQAQYKGQQIAVEILESDRATVEAIASMWSELGINTKIQTLEPAVRAQKLTDHTWLGINTGFSASPLGDPDGLLWRLFGPGGSSRSWTNDEFDRLGQEAHVSLDPAVRQRDYMRMNQIVTDEMGAIPLFQPLRSYGMVRQFHWKPSASGVMDFRASVLTVSA